MHEDSLEALKREEAELQAKLNELRAKKESVLAERRLKEAADHAERERLRPVTVKVLAYTNGNLQVQFDERADLRAIFRPASSWVRERFLTVAEWREIQEKFLPGVPNLSIEWEGDTKEKYDWHLAAPEWAVDVEITGEVSCKHGPDQQSYQYELNRIPGSRLDYAKGMYFVPHPESWRIPQALEKYNDVVYSDAARKLIFDELERRTSLDRIAAQSDSEVLREGLQGNNLRPFQRVGVEFLSATNGRCLLADDTGLGKTWQAVGYAETQRLSRDPSDRAFQTLCIVKSSNIPNWRREVERLTGIKPFVIHGGMPGGQELKACVIDREPYLIISYDTLGSKQYTERHRPEVKQLGQSHKEWNKGVYAWSDLFGMTGPDLLILDEAHQIKNPGTHRFRAVRSLAHCERVIAMTASPILNRTQELWTLLHMTAPMQFDSQEKFEQNYVTGNGGIREAEKLHELLRPMFLRRKKSEVQKDLPPINRITRFHTLSPMAEKRYQEVLDGIYVALEHYDPRGIGGDERSIMGVLSQIGRLKQICAADKVEYTAEIATDIAGETNKKILIFTQYKGTAAKIAQLLGSEAVCTVERRPDSFVSMNAEQRDALFESVRGDPSIRYIVTTTAAQEGHNLEFCSVVMFNDPLWTPEGHRQCEGRAYGRLSDPHPIDSYYIVADVEIEKWIMELLDRKLGIIEEAVDGVENSREVFGSVAKELIRLVKDAQLRQAAKKGGFVL